MSLMSTNKILAGEWFAGIDLLKTVPGSADDVRSTYQDLLAGFEWFGVRYDLPSSVVTRIFASHAENNAPTAGTDGSGAPINVGKWVNGSFDETQALTLDELTARRNSDGTIQRGADGKVISDRPENTLELNSIYSFYLVRACNDPSAIPAYVLRYPNQNIFDSPGLKAGTCAMETHKMDELKARMATNNRNK